MSVRRAEGCLLTAKHKSWDWEVAHPGGLVYDSGTVHASTARQALRLVRAQCWGGPSAGTPSGDYLLAERKGETITMRPTSWPIEPSEREESSR